MTQTITRDTDADPTRVVWAKGGVEWVNDSQSSSIHGQWRWHTGPAAWQLYGYDGAGRLTVVWDQRAGQDCVQRGYSFDVDSNRTQSQAWPAQADGTCPPQTTPVSTAHGYDAADRLLPQGVDAGLAYDAFGRTTALPASAAGGTAATASYYVTDMVAGQVQGTATRSWTLDPAGRLRAATLSGSPIRTNHYSGGGGDSPAWIDENSGAGTLTATRYVTGLDGNLVAEVAHSGSAATARWQLVNLHGDVVTTAADNAALTTPDGPTRRRRRVRQPPRRHRSLRLARRQATLHRHPRRPHPHGRPPLQPRPRPLPPSRPRTRRLRQRLRLRQPRPRQRHRPRRPLAMLANYEGRASARGRWTRNYQVSRGSGWGCWP